MTIPDIYDALVVKNNKFLHLLKDLRGPTPLNIKEAFGKQSSLFIIPSEITVTISELGYGSTIGTIPYFGFLLYNNEIIYGIKSSLKITKRHLPAGCQVVYLPSEITLSCYKLMFRSKEGALGVNLVNPNIK